jgi:hypothetical protein
MSHEGVNAYLVLVNKLPYCSKFSSKSSPCPAICLKAENFFRTSDWDTDRNMNIINGKFTECNIISPEEVNMYLVLVNILPHSSKICSKSSPCPAVCLKAENFFRPSDWDTDRNMNIINGKFTECNIISHEEVNIYLVLVNKLPYCSMFWAKSGPCSGVCLKAENFY